MSRLLDTVKDIFIGGVFTEEINGIDNGGPECAASMTFQFRLTVTIICAFFYYFIYKYTSKKLENEITSDTKKVSNPSSFEKVMGYLSIGIFLLHCSYKSSSKQLIFIMNPCHVLGLIQGYLLISPSGLTQRKIYTVLINTLFSPWIAIFFPVTVGLPGPYEVPMFWVEHFLCALINPLILSLTHRYYTPATISVRNHLFAHTVFGVYQRFILLPLSHVTEANLNFTLCAAHTDPFVEFIGNNYYYISDFYIFLGGEIFHRFVKLLLEVIKFFEAKALGHSHNADDESIKPKTQ